MMHCFPLQTYLSLQEAAKGVTHAPFPGWYHLDTMPPPGTATQSWGHAAVVSAAMGSPPPTALVLLGI